MKNVGVYRLPMNGPDDVSELKKLIDNKTINPEEIVAIIAQTEGDGYARGYANLNFELLLSEALNTTREAVTEKIPMLMIGLTGGLMSPHYTVFTRSEEQTQETDEKRLAIGIAKTRILKPEEYGTKTHVLLVAEAVKQAMKDAQIEDISDVHLVEVKCPNLTAARVADAESRGQKVVSKNFAEAGAKSKGASALGVAVALGEVREDQITDQVICNDWSLNSKVASTSAGNEQVASKVVLFGNSTKANSKFTIASGVMKDTIDVQSAVKTFESLGLTFENGALIEKDQKRIAAAFINAGADATGSIRGRRTTLKSDFLAGYQGIIAKAVINSIVGAMIQDTMILASAGFEHQGPLGSNLLAVIAETE
ncbi:ring-opening amidohydrolase [Liberiplasma polymorphum]|uniref:ring-opening amidohydrolase n=1 Tax=Liberiplasma polymorphum TaxID=3374570 RepID=UPI00377578FE